jgi:MFS family permease
LTPPARTSWPSVLTIYACGIGAGLQFAKVSVLFDALRAHYAASATLTGWFVSAVGLVGVLLGATAGLIVARVGFRVTLIVALAGGAVISLLEATLPPAPLFIALRAVEGAAHLAIVVAAPTCLTGLAAMRDRPLALGLWGTFMSVAFLIGGVVAAPLASALGLGAPFVAHALVMAALAYAAFRVAPRTARAARDPRGLLRRHLDLYSDARSVVPALLWLSYTGMYLAVQTLTPQLASPELRRPMIVGMAFISIVASLTAGSLAHRGLSPFRLTAGAFATTLLASFAVELAVGGGAIVPAALLRMACLSFLPGAILPIIPRLNPDTPSQARAFGAIAQTGNIGSALGPPVFAAAESAYGPFGLLAPVATLCVLGVGLTMGAGRRAAKP